ncbi:universal stress protein [Fundidesulfovibrio soli]|uniref:universal stress protein n=1 Tax=Fundidesulfovibrio soli TaxID=2922716 RepID=UPI001FAF61A6|nr:universal stress protein [Fundidesulfovibrio soli]
MRILLALDESTRAIDEAVKLAAERGAGLTALFVQDATWHDYLGSDWLSGSNARGGYIEWAAEHDMREAAGLPEMLRERTKGIDFELKVASGRVPEEILKELASGAYDLLVMAQPFRRGLEVLRDTAAGLVPRLPCSLYLVRAQDG